ncbi:MAG TPA: nuclear transport factor 2 family protein [Thermoleophilaceae bacterium]|nr:nuclear transport factor 2 family protein [Thermoleophilaceae bacterium]
MSEQNVELVRRVYEEGLGDLGSALRDAHPDFEFTFKAGPRAGTYRGREAAQAVLSDLTAGFDAWIAEPVEFRESGDRVVAIVRNRLRPLGGTGGEFEYRNGHVWTIRDGAIVSFVGFPNPEEALEAVGLRD